MSRAPALSIADQVDAGLRCPLCDYDLRGLVQPRCPECGYGADSWDDLRERIRTSHPFLFEHHPDRNVASFARTLMAGLNPWSFWRSVQPHHVVHPRRLLRYWLTSNLLVLAAMMPLYAHACLTLYQRQAAQQTSLRAQIDRFPSQYTALVRRYGSVEAALDALFPPPPRLRFFELAYRYNYALRCAAAVLAVTLAWPWLVQVVMQVFRGTLRVARIRTVHVARCATYACADVLVWAVALPMLAYTAWVWSQFGPAPAGMRVPGSAREPYHQATAVAGVAAIVLITLRLCVAYRRYLRLRHAVMTALLVQVIVALTLVTFGAVAATWWVARR